MALFQRQNLREGAPAESLPTKTAPACKTNSESDLAFTVWTSTCSGAQLLVISIASGIELHATRYNEFSQTDKKPGLSVIKFFSFSSSI